MTSRRGHGEGAIYKEKGSGLWAAAVSLPPDGSGKRKRTVVRAKLKREVSRKLEDLKAELRLNAPVPDQHRLTSDYLHSWCDNELPGRVKESTADGYRWIIDRYIVPSIGHIRLAMLTPDHVQQMLRGMAERGLSARTQKQTRSILHRALVVAERYGHVTRNVAALVDAPRIGASKVEDALTAEEARKVLAAAEGDSLAALAHLVLALGPRKGEALALRWDDLDLDEGTISITGTMKRRKGGGWYIDQPKTKASGRVIPMTDQVHEALTERRNVQGKEREAAGDAWEEHGFVFTSSVGTPLDERNVLRWWHSLTERAGVGRRRFHASRHTAATLMHENGVQLEICSAILGHSGLAVTFDIYTKISDDAKKKAAITMGNVLREKSASDHSGR